MKNSQKTQSRIVVLILIILFNTSINAQTTNRLPQKAFKKGCLLVSISEGSTSASYTTSTTKDGKSTKTHSEIINGERDPLIIEYGLTNKWGIGITSGNDIFQVNSSDFYGFKNTGNQAISAKTNELTFDLNYHVYVNKRLDASVFTSFGFFDVAFNGKNGDYNYDYNAKGGMMRIGSKARYYFYKRLGAFGMLSYYTGNASPENTKSNSIGNTSTTITGVAIEAGLCFRFF